jgi:hypothetical protein
VGIMLDGGVSMVDPVDLFDVTAYGKSRHALQ